MTITTTMCSNNLKLLTKMSLVSIRSSNMILKNTSSFYRPVFLGSKLISSSYTLLAIQKRHESTVSNREAALQFINKDTQVQDTPINLVQYMEINNTFASSGSSGTIFSDFGPVLYTADLLCSLKDLPGMTWIGVIFFGTIAIRLSIGLPIAVTQQKSIGRMAALGPEMRDLAEQLKRETGMAIRQFGWDEKTAKRQFKKSFKKHWRKLMEEHNCHPMRTICLGLLQVPVWICFSSALRNIVFGLPLPRTEETALRWFEMHQEGLPWVSTLTTTDPVVFPLIFLTTNLVNIHLHNRKKGAIPLSTLQKSLPWILSGGIVCISVFACYVPAAVSMYWAVSSSVALTQNVTLLNPEVRRLLKIPIVEEIKPPTPTPSASPS